MKTVFILPLLFMILVGAGISAQAKIVTKFVTYKEGQTELEGYIAYNDKLKGKRPAVVVVHDWMGLNDYAQMRSRQLAELGYVAFAADIYGKGVRAKTPDEAGKLAGMYKGDRDLLRARVKAALDTLAAQPNVDTKKIGAMGYCFGGTTVLELARSGADVKGVISFHGGLDFKNPDDAKNIKGKLLILHGAIDPYVAQKDIDQLVKELNANKVDYQFVSYSGAVHAFTNSSLGTDISKGAAYNASADKRSFEAMKDFFSETL